MTKTLLTRNELASRVLGAIREHPACRGVTEIAITPVTVVGQGRTWHVNIIDSGFSRMDISMTVAREVAERMQPHFELEPEGGSDELNQSNGDPLGWRA